MKLYSVTIQRATHLIQLELQIIQLGIVLIAHATIQGTEDEDIRNNFVKCFVVVSNVDSYFEGEHKMYIPKNKELRKISGSKMGDVGEEAGILHNQKLNYLYMSASTLKLANSSRL
jgi:hypothetical protein